MTSSPRETVLCHYHYDPLDRLINHALPDTPERQRFYCKSRLATEIQGAMRYSIVQQADQLLAQHRSEGDAREITLLVTDQQRSVLQTVKANHPPQSITYSPYGHRSVESGLLSLLGFTGERPDPVTGCYLLGNGYRAFNSVLMRFNSPDSLSPFGKGGVNSYAYCFGDPINLYDQNGHFPLITNASSFMGSLLKRSTKTPKSFQPITTARYTHKLRILNPVTREGTTDIAITLAPPIIGRRYSVHPISQPVEQFNIHTLHSDSISSLATPRHSLSPTSSRASTNIDSTSVFSTARERRPSLDTAHRTYMEGLTLRLRLSERLYEVAPVNSGLHISLENNINELQERIRDTTHDYNIANSWRT
ncbi:RHS repeat-associated core domain-containing protein [Pseudomonas sp. WJP1]|uniref:RHS repeat-associated core domain-containing protein n=1 Tax=Pseudomonas sp. WJP1 TaxID=2986947 RepID=UPI00234A0733|nr:RHS repeat-associated core domain-containing protein [Pseudomonas sp. WJP1]WCM49944.1 RHS repeat-associated core domain-containing protein [Pseudomonas sp. WJP1]